MCRPAPGNYRNWNITAEDLMITFDDYQDAAYAYGAHIVPYDERKDLFDPHGKLGTLIE